MWHRCPFCIYRLFHFVDTDRKTVVSGLMLLYRPRDIYSKSVLFHGVVVYRVVEQKHTQS